MNQCRGEGETASVDGEEEQISIKYKAQPATVLPLNRANINNQARGNIMDRPHDPSEIRFDRNRR